MVEHGSPVERHPHPVGLHHDRERVPLPRRVQRGVARGGVGAGDPVERAGGAVRVVGGVDLHLQALLHGDRRVAAGVGETDEDTGVVVALDLPGDLELVGGEQRRVPEQAEAAAGREGAVVLPLERARTRPSATPRRSRPCRRAARVQPSTHDGTGALGPPGSGSEPSHAQPASRVAARRAPPARGRTQRTPRGRSWTLIRGPTGLAVLGTACSQVRWHEPPMTSRSPCPRWWRSAGAPPPFGRSSSAAGCPEGQDRDHRVLGAGAADAVAVPGHRVAAVAVEAEAGRGERLAELGRVVLVEGRLDGVEHGVGQRVALAVEAEQAGHVDDLVVHLAPLGVPGHALDQPGEQVVGAVQPARQDVDPRAVRQQRCAAPGRPAAAPARGPAPARGRAGSPARSAPHPSPDRTPVRTSRRRSVGTRAPIRPPPRAPPSPPSSSPGRPAARPVDRTRRRATERTGAGSPRPVPDTSTAAPGCAAAGTGARDRSGHP